MATRSIQIKKVRSIKIYYPFPSIHGEFSKARVSRNETNFIIRHYHKQASIRQRENLMSNIIGANYL